MYLYTNKSYPSMYIKYNKFISKILLQRLVILESKLLRASTFSMSFLLVMQINTDLKCI